MSAQRADAQPLWIVLLTGRGPQPSRGPAGLPVAQPSPFATTAGQRSMLLESIDRALLLTPSERLFVVTTAEFRDTLDGSLGGLPSGLLFEQPRDCGTAAAVLLPLTHVLEREPRAIMLVMPASHFVYPRHRFLHHLENAIDLVRSSGRVVMLGATPTDPDLVFEWQETAPAVGAGADGRSEGPGAGLDYSLRQGLRRRPQGLPNDAALRETNIVVAPAATLWRIVQRLIPNEARAFDTLRQVLRGVHDGRAPMEHERLAIAHIHRELGRADFTRDVLLRAQEAARVITMFGVLWKDCSGSDQFGEQVGSNQGARRMTLL